MYRDSENNSGILHERHKVKSIHIYLYIYNTYIIDAHYLELAITKKKNRISSFKKYITLRAISNEKKISNF